MKFAIVDDEMEKKYKKDYLKYFTSDDEVFLFEDAEDFIIENRDNFFKFDVIILDYFYFGYDLSFLNIKKIFDGYNNIFCASVMPKSIQNPEFYKGIIDKKNLFMKKNFNLREFICKMIVN